MRIGKTLFTATLLVLTAAALPALEGSWEVTAQVTLPVDEANTSDVMPDCSYSGSGTFTDMGQGTFGGTLTLDLQNANPNCPGSMMGNVSGTEGMDGSITGTITSGMFGELGFSGQPSVGAGAQAANNLAGGLDVRGAGDSQDFTGATGSWSAQQTQQAPTLDPRLLALLAVVLVVGGSLAVLRRRSTG